MAEGDRAQERPKRGRGVRPGEDPAHPTVSQQRHVIDRVRTRDHPGDQRCHLQPRVRALVRGDREVLISQVPQSRGVGQREHRDQPTGRHEVRIVERHRRSTKGVRESHLRDALRVAVESLPEEHRFSRAARAFSLHDALTDPSPSVDRGLGWDRVWCRHPGADGPRRAGGIRGVAALSTQGELSALHFRDPGGGMASYDTFALHPRALARGRGPGSGTPRTMSASSHLPMADRVREAGDSKPARTRTDSTPSVHSSVRVSGPPPTGPVH